MARDRRYKAVKALVEKGEISFFNEMFDYIPKTRVANDLGKNNSRFTKLLNRTEQFRLEELFTVARFLGLDDKQILDLAYNQYVQQKRKRKGTK